MKQTAVEWLVEQLKERGYAGEFPPHILFEQAKEMEKEQQGYSEENLEDAFSNGFTNCYNNNNLTFGEWFEQFKKK